MNNQLTENNATPPSTLNPSGGVEGLEDIDASDVRIPQAKLLQGSCNEIKSPDDYPDLRVGMIVNSITKEELAKEDNKYPFIPIKMFKTWVKFNARKDSDPGFDPNHKPGGLIFKFYTVNDLLTKTNITKEDEWKYKQINFMTFQPGDPNPLVLTFSGRSVKTANDIISAVRLAGRPLWEHKILIGQKSEEKDGDTFQVLTAALVGKPEANICEIGKQMYNEFNPILADMKNSTIKIADDTELVAPSDDAPWNKG